MKRSEFVAQFAQHGEAAARAAEKAGAIWEPEGLPEVEDVLWTWLRRMQANAVLPTALDLAPAGELRPRKLAAPLRLEQGDDDLLHLYDATGREILWTGGLSEDETDIFRELVKHYNDAPSAWPAPRRAVPGDPASQPAKGCACLRFYGGVWLLGHPSAVEVDGWWLPQPPPPPEEG